MKYSQMKMSGPRLPSKVAVGFSGGVDSVAALNYLAHCRDVEIVFVDHVTDGLSHLADFASDIANMYGAKFHFHRLSDDHPGDNVSHESWWRHGRYEFFHSLNIPVVTGHHLDDCVETWIWSALRGVPSIIPYRNKNVVRPFRTSRKEAFVKWAEKKNLTWHEDENNKDDRYTRNFIRNNMIEDCLVVNPGLYKTVRNIVIEDLKNVREYQA